MTDTEPTNEELLTAMAQGADEVNSLHRKLARYGVEMPQVVPVAIRMDLLIDLAVGPARMDPDDPDFVPDRIKFEIEFLRRLRDIMEDAAIEARKNSVKGGAGGGSRLIVPGK